MHFRLPKRLHGWREFAAEVGIIGIGVLIALGAEQGVEKWQWRHRARQAVEALSASATLDTDLAMSGPVVFCRAHHLPLGKPETIAT